MAKLQLTPDWLIGPKNAGKAVLMWAMIAIVAIGGIWFISQGGLAALGTADLSEVDNGTVEVDNSTDLVYADLDVDNLEDHGNLDSANYTATLTGTSFEMSKAPNAARGYAIELNQTDETIRVDGGNITDGDSDGVYDVDLSTKTETTITSGDDVVSAEAIAIAIVELEDDTETVVNSTTVDLVPFGMASAEFEVYDGDGNRSIETGNYTVTVYGDTGTIDTVEIGTTVESGGTAGSPLDGNEAEAGVAAIGVFAVISGVLLARGRQ